MNEQFLSKPYKQEGELIPFTATFLLGCNNFDQKFFNTSFDKLSIYFKNGYTEAFWDSENFNKASHEFFKKYYKSNEFQELFDLSMKDFDLLEKEYFKYTSEDINNMTEKVLINFLNTLLEIYKSFWSRSLFIDAFDVGYDTEQIKNISKQYEFTPEEIGILTTPFEMAFTNEKKLSLLNIVKNLPAETPIQSINNFVQESQIVKDYIKNFDYYKSNYAKIEHITPKEIEKEIIHYVEKPDLFKKEYEYLKNYKKNSEEKINTILKKYKLKNNPLHLFNVLTFWRERRKQVNLMGIHILFDILKSLEYKTKIPLKYLSYLMYDEVDKLLNGTITLKTLELRYKEGFLVHINKESFTLISGNEALSIKNALDKQINQSQLKKIIYGTVASQGYAKGIAKIIMNVDDFDKLQPGEILITSMTRPEFVPLMKKASGIVTNEGGITCHAAIVSRELKKPCIICTKNATQIIKDGDLIEVRAHHGSVRILD